MKVEMSAFNNLIGQIDGAYHDVITRLGLSDSVFDILYILCEEGDGCRQSVLYKKSGCGKTTINSAIRKMEQQGLLYLSPGEGRNTLVHLTEAGKKLQMEKVYPVIEVENEIFMSWPERDRNQFMELNRRFLEDFLKRAGELG